MKFILYTFIAAFVSISTTVGAAKAASFDIGSTINLDTDCATAAGCTLIGTPAPLGATGFDLSYWTFIGSANTTYEIGVTPSVDAQSIFTAGSTPIGPSGAGGYSVQNFLAGVPGILQIGFGLATEQTLNWITASGSLLDFAGETLTYSTFDPDDQAPAVPLPAAGWMLIAGLGGLVAMRRRKAA